MLHVGMRSDRASGRTCDAARPVDLRDPMGHIRPDDLALIDPGEDNGVVDETASPIVAPPKMQPPTE